MPQILKQVFIYCIHHATNTQAGIYLLYTSCHKYSSRYLFIVYIMPQILKQVFIYCIHHATNTQAGIYLLTHFQHHLLCSASSVNYI